MKTLILFCAVLLFPLLGFAQTTTNSNYDEKLARELHADDFGMKMYILVLLKKGSNNVTDLTVRDSLFSGHFANINRLISLKKMVVAGPLEKNEQSYHGIFVLDVPTMEEAKMLLDDDPTIKQKIFVAELYNWYGPAALPTYLITSDKLWKQKP